MSEPRTGAPKVPRRDTFGSGIEAPWSRVFVGSAVKTAPTPGTVGPGGGVGGPGGVNGGSGEEPEGGMEHGAQSNPQQPAEPKAIIVRRLAPAPRTAERLPMGRVEHALSAFATAVMRPGFSRRPGFALLPVP